MAQPLDDLLKNVGALAPGLEALGQAGKDNLKNALQNLLQQLDLVSREEFDIQAALLDKANHQLTTLQARLEALEGNNQTTEDSTQPESK